MNVPYEQEVVGKKRKSERKESSERRHGREGEGRKGENRQEGRRLVMLVIYGKYVREGEREEKGGDE